MGRFYLGKLQPSRLFFLLFFSLLFVVSFFSLVILCCPSVKIGFSSLPKIGKWILLPQRCLLGHFVYFFCPFFICSLSKFYNSDKPKIQENFKLSQTNSMSSETMWRSAHKNGKARQAAFSATFKRPDLCRTCTRRIKIRKFNTICWTHADHCRRHHRQWPRLSNILELFTKQNPRVQMRAKECRLTLDESNDYHANNFHYLQ